MENSVLKDSPVVQQEVFQTAITVISRIYGADLPWKLQDQKENIDKNCHTAMRQPQRADLT